jgi:hypothetical protein
MKVQIALLIIIALTISPAYGVDIHYLKLIHNTDYGNWDHKQSPQPNPSGKSPYIDFDTIDDVKGLTVYYPLYCGDVFKAFEKPENGFQWYHFPAYSLKQVKNEGGAVIHINIAPGLDVRTGFFFNGNYENNVVQTNNLFVEKIEKLIADYNIKFDKEYNLFNKKADLTIYKDNKDLCNIQEVECSLVENHQVNFRFVDDESSKCHGLIPEFNDLSEENNNSHVVSVTRKVTVTAEDSSTGKSSTRHCASLVRKGAEYKFKLCFREEYDRNLLRDLVNHQYEVPSPDTDLKTHIVNLDPDDFVKVDFDDEKASHVEIKPESGNPAEKSRFGGLFSFSNPGGAGPVKKLLGNLFGKKKRKHLRRH